ncbi:UvrD-helicase domain-containing protein [Yinghuangia seranimata]|uniref:UvrD-helicase domain-containing protein n=1 Tax=Yinghuangia seranimata TaxID=408067 RepID=UPI00248BA4F2|nr:UvrD-helicase domain-containing protein [Yinghuangia seranimata]MDI2125088.1 exodeoxyribonuclease V subunit gamma [Yinghuangia seranimata]
MPQLAFHIEFLKEMGKLPKPVVKEVLEAWEKFGALTLDDLFKHPGLKLETLTRARDPHIRTIRIDQMWRGVVVAPERGDTFTLLRVLPHDKAIDWAVKQRVSINTVTRAVEIRNAAELEVLAPAYEQIAPAAERRLFAKISDTEMAALGIDADTLRAARVLTTQEQLEVFAPHFPQDQREVLEYLAAGFSVEEVWQDVVVQSQQSAAELAHDHDFDTAVRNSHTRIALVSAPDELRDILGKPFDAWRIFLHPSQHKIAYRPSYSGPAQVRGGPGTGKTVVALHRVKHLMGHLRDGERILLTTYTKALVHALKSGLAALVPDEMLRGRVDITTVDAFAGRVVTAARGEGRRPVSGRDEDTHWAEAAKTTGFPGTPQFLAQEYKHVILAQDLTSLEAYAAADRAGRGTKIPQSLRPQVWAAVHEFHRRLREGGQRTYLQTCDEAARILASRGPMYRHIVVDEAQDLHPAQWRLLRAAAAVRPDDLFIAGDPHQRIYDSRVSLKALGISVAGRSAKMRKNYRSTHEILRWSTSLLVGRPIAQLEDENRSETLLGYRSALHGDGPELHHAVSDTVELAALVTRVRAWMEAGVLPGEIGVTSRFNNTGDMAVAQLKSVGIPAVRLNADGSGATDAVQVGTMHSFKGLEFRCVAVIGAHDGALPFPRAVTPVEVDQLQHEADLAAERCLLFVACTRARDGLYVSWSGKPSRFLTEAGAV